MLGRSPSTFSPRRQHHHHHHHPLLLPQVKQSTRHVINSNGKTPQQDLQQNNSQIQDISWFHETAEPIRAAISCIYFYVAISATILVSYFLLSILPRCNSDVILCLPISVVLNPFQVRTRKSYYPPSLGTDIF